MPHSSGGGSHGGGIHGGRYHGRAVGGGFGSGLLRRRRRRRFYSDNFFDMPRYATSNIYHGKPKKPSVLYFAYRIILSVLVLTVGIILVYEGYQEIHPHKLTQSRNYGAVRHIDDTDNLLDNKDELEKTLSSFENITGIRPCIKAVCESEWKEVTNDLESYTHYEVINIRDDDNRFLIVYSVPDSEYASDDYEWDSVYDICTQRIITEERYQHFIADMDGCLSDKNNSFSDALIRSFTEASDYFMTPNTDNSEAWYMITAGAVISLLILAYVVFLFKSFVDKRRDYNVLDHNEISYRQM